MRTGFVWMVSGCLVLGGVGVVSAAEFSMKPGKWQFTTTSTMPMMPEPQTRTSTKCFDEDDTNPETAMQKLTEDSKCKVNDQSMDGDTFSWKVQCSGKDGSSMSGEGQLQGMGDTAKGKMRMGMSVHGQKMEMKIDWEGKRLGDCE